MIRDVVKKSINVKSRIQVKHVDDINNFLLSCAYKSDEALFNKSDYWQTPIEFEENRCGDCEDFALWARVKLLEIGKTPIAPALELKIYKPIFSMDKKLNFYQHIE